MRNKPLYIGMPTWGGDDYTRMAINAIDDLSMDIPIELVMVGQIDKGSGGLATANALGIPNHYIAHLENKGLPAAINDIMDYVFGERGADKILWVTNDVLPYPNAIQTLLEAAAFNPEFDFIRGREMTPRGFTAHYPQYADDFDDDLKLKQFPFTHYLKHWGDVTKGLQGNNHNVRTLGHVNDFHNFSLMRRSFFKKVGYVDAGFYPAYFEDVDYVRRGKLVGLKFAEAIGSWYFHFHGRTAKEVHGEKTHRRYFALNEAYYKAKWGGEQGRETNWSPFAGQRIAQTFDRKNEQADIDFWRWVPALFRDKHRGQRCIIAGGGPSLNDIDMNLLKGEIVFGLNRFQLKSDMPVTYGVATNRLLLEQFGASLSLADIEALFIPRLPELWKPHVYGLTLDGGPPRFSPDITQPIYEGHTVSFVALQIAFFMGFQEILLIGMDHYYPHVPKEIPPDTETVLKKGTDKNHFDPKYFGVGVRWQTPNLPKAEESYILARDAYEKAGRRIINCSVHTKLDVFLKGELKEVLHVS